MKPILVILLACMQQANGAEFKLPPESWTGIRDQHNIVSFKGLPFAAAPVGDLRWKPPMPYKPKDRHTVAARFPAACMQGPHIETWYRDLVQSLGYERSLIASPEGGYSEDCLYLNIWSGSPEPGANMPVMVWIHGGSNKGGWSYEPNYHGHMLARHDVVVVSIPYRLGIFGFFSHPDLVQEQSGRAGNYGLLDLIHGLKWIQSNIREFGGDPGNVTLFGESAGATNINFLMAAPEAKHLFHKAIHQSAGYEYHQDQTLGDLTRTGADLSLALGLADIASLRKQSGLELLNAVEKHMPDLSFGSVIAGHGLDASPFDVFQSGNQAPVPLMIGTNADEWLMYIGDNDTVKEYLGNYDAISAMPEIERLLSRLPRKQKLDRISTASEMLCPSIEMASAVTASKKSVYFYHFSRVREGPYWQDVGAYHGAEIPYIFDTHDRWLETRDPDRQLTTSMARYWLNFARRGDPNQKGMPGWRPFRRNNPSALDLGEQIKMKPVPDLALCRLMGWNL